MQGKRVLITGGLGFIGSNLARRCLALGAKVTVYDCLDPRSGGNMQNVQDIQDDLEIILNDIRQFDGISACIRNKDVLFSCAAYTSHPNSMKEPLIDIDVNCKGVINLLEAARRFNPAIKMVHVGTSTQIGKMYFDKIDERHPEFPLDIYSANKSASEKYVLIYGNAYQMRTTVVRLTNCFGPRSNIVTPEFGFINYFIGLALQKRELTVFGEGQQKRNVLYVDDAVEALILAAQNDASNGQPVFAAADSHYTVAEIATEIAQCVGGKVRFVEWPKDRRTIEVGDAVFDNSRAKELLGWNAKVGFGEGLVATREYFEPRLGMYLK